MPNSDRSARSINFGLFLRKAGGISNLMQTLQNLGLSTTTWNFLGPFSESARNFRLSREVGVFEHVNTGFFDEPISEPICRMPNLYVSTDTGLYVWVVPWPHGWSGPVRILTSGNLYCTYIYFGVGHSRAHY
jgi:hypothetical protein